MLRPTHLVSYCIQEIGRPSRKFSAGLAIFTAALLSSTLLVPLATAANPSITLTATGGDLVVTNYAAVTNAIFGTGWSNFGGLRSKSSPSTFQGQAIFSGPWPTDPKIVLTLTDNRADRTSPIIGVQPRNIFVTHPSLNLTVLTYTSDSVQVTGDSVYSASVKIMNPPLLYGFDMETYTFNYKMALGCSAWLMTSSTLVNVGKDSLSAWSTFTGALKSIVDSAKFLPKSVRTKMLDALDVLKFGDAAGYGADFIDAVQTSASSGAVTLAVTLKNVALKDVKEGVIARVDPRTKGTIATIQLSKQQAIALYKGIVSDGATDAKMVSSCSGNSPQTPLITRTGSVAGVSSTQGGSGTGGSGTGGSGTGGSGTGGSGTGGSGTGGSGTGGGGTGGSGTGGGGTGGGGTGGSGTGGSGTGTVSLSQGPAAPHGYRYAITLSNFAPNSSVAVNCYDSVSPGGFFRFTMGTDGSGNASTASQCYSGDGPDHWVIAGGVSSNHIQWVTAAPVIAPPPVVSGTVSLSQGPAAPHGYRYAITLSNFAPNSSVAVNCYDSVSPGGFFPFTMGTDGSGNASTASQCYSGDGPDHWVIAGGVSSNHIQWVTAAPVIAPPPVVSGTVSLSQGPAAPHGYRYAITLSNFAPNSSVAVNCYDSVSPGGFFPFTMGTDGSGNASTASQCYSGDGPDHWVIAGGVSSNHIQWVTAAPVIAPPPVVSGTVSLSQGPAAPHGYRYAITLSNFAPNSSVAVNCYDSVSPGGFFPFTMGTDGSGNASTASQCYSGDGPDHWVIAGGVSSNHIQWVTAAPVIAPPPVVSGTVSLSQGPAAPHGYRYAITLSNFAPNSSVAVNCYDSVSPGGFFPFTMGTDGSGNASTASQCYSGDGPDHWVIAGGVSSNHIQWVTAAPVIAPPPVVSGTVSLSQGPAAPHGYRYAITLSNFAPNSSVAVNCYDSVSPGGFFPFTMGTDGSGNASTASQCYSGDGPDHWVIAGGVSSNHIQWVTAAPVIAPPPPPPPLAPTWGETTGGSSNTWSNYANAGGSQGPSIGTNQTVAVACKVNGFRVSDGNTWWYKIAQSPWSNQFFVSADGFYNNGATSGSLHGTPYVDPAVPSC